MPNHPVGKGVFVWKLEHNTNGDMGKLASDLSTDGYQWAAIQCHVGTTPANVALMPQAVQTLSDVGIELWLWGYVKPGIPGQNTALVKQSKIVFDLCELYPFKGFFVDAEVEWKEPGLGFDARAYMRLLAASIADRYLGLCSYRYPRLHKSIPWCEFSGLSDFHAPQVYWEGSHNSAYQLIASKSQVEEVRPLPVIPIGSAYWREKWTATPEDVDAFDKAAKAEGCPGVGWWSWSHIPRLPKVRAAIAAHKWEG